MSVQSTSSETFLILNDSHVAKVHGKNATWVKDCVTTRHNHKLELVGARSKTMNILYWVETKQSKEVVRMKQKLFNHATNITQLADIVLKL